MAERRGSYEVEIAFLLGAAFSGIIGNRADAAVVWSFRKLLRWYHDLAKTYVSVKRQTTDIEAVARALEQLASGHDVSLWHAPRPVEDADQLRLVPAPDDDDDEARVEPVNPSRMFAERIDGSLKAATAPLERSCDKISVLAQARKPLIELGIRDRQVIAEPLTLPPPNRTWRPARVKFDRINNKTGRALFRFESEPDAGQGA